MKLFNLLDPNAKSPRIGDHFSISGVGRFNWSRRSLNRGCGWGWGHQASDFAVGKDAAAATIALIDRRRLAIDTAFSVADTINSRLEDEGRLARGIMIRVTDNLGVRK